MKQESNRTTPRLLGLRTLKGALQRLSVTMLLMLLTTATAWADVVTYINANGQSTIAEDATLLDGLGFSLGQEEQETWYYVDNDITYNDQINCDGDVHIILADGKTLTINSGANGIDVHGSLTIYGQAKGTGTLNVTGDDTGIYTFSGTITICGGTVNVTGNNEGIHSYSGSITISGGRFTATANGAGISTNIGTITLGCTTASDFIYASSYFIADPQGSLKIAEEQKLYDEDRTEYSGTLTGITIPNGKTLCSFFPNVIAQYIDAAGKPARCAAIPLYGGGSSLGQDEQATWYYVGNDITYNGTIECLGDVHIILADGKTMTINSDNNGIVVYDGDSLTIYGQAKGTGTLTATGKYGNGIFTNSGTITICGGTVTVTSEDAAGILTNSGDITISGGRVTVTATSEYKAGISTNIGTITLGCTTASDFIYASSYSVGTPPGSVNIADGQTLFDEYDNPYIGDGITIPDGVTLCSFPHVIAQYIDAAGKPARCAAIPLSGEGSWLNAGWYYVDTDITYNDQINYDGDVHIILADGKTLTITSNDGDGIDVNDGSLTIYGQELGTGTLNATGHYEGIHSESGDITICGGTVNATGEGGEGIHNQSGDITISGGRVTVTGGYEGIHSESGDITISGGTVTVTGDNEGIHNQSSDITICGGTVTVTGDNEGIHSESGDITICGGTVTATGEDGDGIHSDRGTITISGGRVTATGYNVGNGIHSNEGPITISSGTVDATGGDYGNGISSFEGSITISGGTVTATGEGIHSDSGVITIGGGTVNAKGISSFEGPITISGGNVDATGEGIHSNEGPITISGGTVTAKGEYGDGIHSDSGDITISGGRVNATATSTEGAGISSDSGTITLGWTSASDFIYASSYKVLGEASLKIAEEQKLYDEDGTEYIGTLDNIPDGATLRPFPYVNVYDSEDNSEAINGSNGQQRNVILYDRTLYKDGEWNTLCLPFNVTITGSVLDGADVRALDTNATGYDHATGLDGSTLYLNFTAEGAVKKIEAGVPYIIKWPATEPDYIENPVFQGVTVEDGLNDIIFPGGAFKGTYAWQEYTQENKSILLLGAENTLYWPKPDGDMYPSIGAFRAYFELGGGYEAREFVLNFGEIETSLPQPLQREGSQAGAWFDLSGRKLDSKPTKKGLYIHEGRKVVIP